MTTRRGRTQRMTRRQRAVCDLLIDGHSTAAIAKRLRISAATVGRLIGRTGACLGVTGRARIAAAYARLLERPNRAVDRWGRPPASPLLFGADRTLSICTMRRKVERLFEFDRAFDALPYIVLPRAYLRGWARWLAP